MRSDIEDSTGESLSDLLDRIDVHPPGTSFGEDIDLVHRQLFSACPARRAGGNLQEDRVNALLTWMGRFQPCLFGRLAARGLKGVGADICWIDEAEIRRGDDYLRQKVQAARRAWKDRAEEGGTHGLLIMFSAERFARARPGAGLLKACRRVADLYLPEHAPVRPDHIYTEALPLRTRDGLRLYKAGINVFYPSAHRTRNHDRRVPGGLLISVNSVGHLANSMVERGMAPDLGGAVDAMMDLALRSIGNGGLGEPRASCTWHNTEHDHEARAARRPLGALPRHVPKDHSQRHYSGVYHTDVLVPLDVTVDGTLDPDIRSCPHWKNLSFDYISEQRLDPGHENHGFFHGEAVTEDAKYDSPWEPVPVAPPGQRRGKAASIAVRPESGRSVARLRTLLPALRRRQGSR